MTAQQQVLRVGDRRSGHRYPIAADLEYRVICGHEVIQTGLGRTLNLSKSGILFESEQFLPAGTELEISVAWPVRLHDAVALNLCVSGQVAWSQAERHALKFRRHEFRLRGRYGLSNRRLNPSPDVRPAKAAPEVAAVNALL